jgi:hypothetical protein
MSYPYPPMPGQPPSGGQPGGWGTPPLGGYGAPQPGGYPPPMANWHGQDMAGGPQLGPPMGPPPGKSSAGLIVAVIIGAIVLVGGSLGGAYYLAAAGGGNGPATPTPSAAASSSGGRAPGITSSRGKPVTYDSMKSWSLWDSLNTASQDAKPLTLDEVFADPEAKAYKDGRDSTTFNLQGTGRLDTDCGSTVSGAELKTLLQSYGCTQVVRAAYVSADQRWVGQLAIFNLRDVTSANAFLDDLDPKSGKGFFTPVTGASPVDKFGSSVTGAESGAYGHFVVVGWAGRVDGGETSSDGFRTISASSSVRQAGKQFLFHRN